MLNKIISFSLKNRLLVVAAAALLLVYGIRTIINLPIDVLPDLNRPRVTVMTEAHGLSPEEVEVLITIPIENALNGATGVKEVRSNSGVSLSIVFVEFDWDTDILIARQTVAEKLQLVKEKLPADVTPVMGPISSVMGQIQIVGISATDSTSKMDIRTIADWTLRPRILSISGVSQVINIGGDVKQYQVLVDPNKMKDFKISLKEVEDAIGSSNSNTTGGFTENSNQEYLLRNIGRAASIEEVANSIVAYRENIPVSLKQIATVKVGPPIKRGDGGMNGKPAVLMAIEKQPNANTVELTKDIDKAIDEIQKTLPPGIVINKDVFKQSNFIESSISNVEEALRDGGILVMIVLFLFLLNFRTTFITLTAIPLSFVITALVFQYFGISVNTMTLGGLAVAIGELVDDAIVDVENVFRRLKENRLKEHPEPYLKVIYMASSEIRNSIVYATIIVVLVFIPLFSLSGIEGRIFAPLGISYIVSILASLVVSLTVTPVLCSYLLPKAKLIEKDSFLVRWLKKQNVKILNKTLVHPAIIISVSGMLVAISIISIIFMGTEFLPPFNEGALTINILSPPGTSLTESNRIGTIAEKLILKVPEVISTGRRTGRAELDEHAEGVHSTEIEVELKKSDRPKEEVLNDLREKLAIIPGVNVSVGQPISHRLDHLLSGVRAQIAVKLFGDDLSQLRSYAVQIEEAMKTVDGVVDLQIEKQVLIPQIRIKVKRDEASKYGLSAGDVTGILETAYNGTVVSQILDGQKTYDMIVRFDDKYRDDIDKIKFSLIDTPSGVKIPLSTVADVLEDKGPNIINRENVKRRIVIQSNVSGRDLGSVVDEIQKKIDTEVKLPSGYFITYGGQFEAQRSASKLILILSLFSFAAIFLVLYMHFKSARIVIQILLNIPLALIGSVIAIYLTGGVMSIASMVGFVTLTGIASRNGIMRISHYIHLIKEEGESFNKEMIIRGSLERLVPVLMTASVAGLGLIPLILSAGEPGKEILFPVAVVIFGGLISSTLLDMVVTPTVFYKFGKKAVEKYLEESTEKDLIGEAPVIEF
ncbi:MAG: efflux RND transporter permease subunit [Ignavibacteriae bacterium]|nr:efflux RND transporter permease subunit [Ignavibacteriota bacterium]